MKPFRLLINISALLALVVIALGAYTRLTDAGLGCPDWPGCYGSLTIPHSEAHIAAAQVNFPNSVVELYKARNEMLHRYLAGSLGLCIAAIFFLSFWLQQQRWLSSALLLLVIFQAALGMWTVTFNLLPLVVVAHLFGGFSIFALLMTLRLNLNKKIASIHEPQLVRLRPLASVALAVLLLQILMGGWTSANYAALVCHQLPFCEAGWEENFSLASAVHLPLGHETYEYGVMPYEGRMSVHVLHRMGALLTLCTLVLFGYFAWRSTQQRQLRRQILLLLFLLLLQITLGLINILSLLPLWNAVAHNLVAANLLMVLWLWVYRLYRADSPPVNV